MEKILKIFIISLLSFSFLEASSNYQAKLKKFDLNYQKVSKSGMLKYHNMLKNIYIQSVIKNDYILKIKTLRRLIISSSKLGLSTSSYKKELLTLEKMAGKKGFPIKKLKLAKLPDVKKKSNYKKIIKKKVYSTKTIAKIRKIQTSSKGVSLIFDENTKDVHVKHFVLKGKKSGYRYVYDINAILMGKSRKFKIKNISQIRIVQYNKKITRMVFEDKKKIKFYISKIDNTINIGSKNLRPKIATKTKKTSSSKKIKYNFNPNSKIVVIDAGHGGKDGGAFAGHKINEKKLTLQVALRLGKELKSRGFRVYYTRIRDKFIQLRSRTKMANHKKADLFISVHANAAPNKKKYKQMHGIETFFLSPTRSERSKNAAAQENKSDMAEMDYFSKQTFLNFLNREKIIASNKLALDIQQGMLNSVRKKYKIQDGGVREAPFWVLVGAQMPAVLVEIGYITHPVEGKRIASSSYQTYLANGIANGIGSYFQKNN